jgi:Cd2+/Zn2+-exporting ATPase
MGIAGTDVAIETADVGLLSDDLSKMPHLIMVSRKAIAPINKTWFSPWACWRSQ